VVVVVMGIGISSSMVGVGVGVTVAVVVVREAGGGRRCLVRRRVCEWSRIRGIIRG
jgi:hypothetical protein